MDSGLKFPWKSYIYWKSGACVSSRKSSVSFNAAAVTFPSTWMQTSSTRRKFGKSLRIRHLPRLRLGSSGSWPQFRQNAAVPKTLRMRSKMSAADAGGSISLRADANMEAEHSQENERDSDSSEFTSEVTEEAVEDVTEFQLSGDEIELKEIGTSLFSIKTGKKIIMKIRDAGMQFVVNNVQGVIGLLKIGQNQSEPVVLQLRTSMIEKQDGVEAVHQWSATELTMQHVQLARIAIDIKYLVFAFTFFGLVRILETTVAVFSTNAPALRKMMQSLYALDYLVISWLAFNLRKPIISMLQVDPTDLKRVAILKVQVWEELHAFFARQWKVMTAVAVARFLGIVANYVPSFQWMTNHVKIAWDMLMAVPPF
ncbi:uncharacterized protein [Physcomitrium patens]|nr:uncharacterized protein LOC112287687 isoform X3 [Physcomitrium patens]XP_024386737.1 uncharacterized protein LOC112287687 isoform X3 [Physcomitrium patens]|eukprot:XP_024386736.1 uncharacterized protein LOC112287687 isoform X3 [Physcomitrella patens]